MLFIVKNDTVALANPINFLMYASRIHLLSFVELFTSSIIIYLSVLFIFYFLLFIYSFIFIFFTFEMIYIYYQHTYYYYYQHIYNNAQYNYYEQNIFVEHSSFLDLIMLIEFFLTIQFSKKLERFFNTIQEILCTNMPY